MININSNCRIVISQLMSSSLTNSNFIEQPWAIISSYFRGNHLEQLVRHQLESSNNFMENQIAKTIAMFNPVTIASKEDFNTELNLHKLSISITFDNFNIFRPQIYENNGTTKLMFPQEARLRNFTYSGASTFDVHIKYTIRTGDALENIRIINKTIANVHIGKLPFMVNSKLCVLNQHKHIAKQHFGECKYDTGGYYIIKGSEKTVLGQERAAENKIYCFNVSKTNTKYAWSAEIKSIPDSKCISPKQISLLINSKQEYGQSIHVQLPRVKQPIPLFILFRALGVISDKDICNKILLNIDTTAATATGATTTDPMQHLLLSSLQSSIEESSSYVNHDDCIKYITSIVMFSTPPGVPFEIGAARKLLFTKDILSNDLFPHCHTQIQKIYFLGYMAYRLLLTSNGILPQDDRDSYLNKRVDLTGSLLNNLYRNYFNKLVKDLEKQTIIEINKGAWKASDDYENIINLTNISKLIKSTTIENGIKRALSTGDFGIKHSSVSKVGVAQVLSRLNYVAAVSHLRRVSTPVDKSGKLIPPRKLHNTSWGYLCPAETPEGQSVGVVKNMSYMAYITIQSNSEIIYNIVIPLITPIETVDSTVLYDKVKVFINGNWVGISETPYELYLSLKEKKYAGVLNIYTSIVFDCSRKEIRICNDAGRLTRPVLRVKNKNILVTQEIINGLNNMTYTWNDLLTNIKFNNSIIEYIDAEEESMSLIATFPKTLHNGSYTHCEIHPSTMFGILASCIPFPEHNQSPRNTYQCAQGKQAMGIYATNYNIRMDKTAYILNYPMRPLIDTRVMNIIKLNEIPSGSQVIVAIMTHTGYNQEDSILINKGSIDRGLALATIYHTERDEDKQKINGDEEIRCKPDKSKTKGMKLCDYSKICSNGLVPLNTLISNRDIIIAKVKPIKEHKNNNNVIKFEDNSKMYKTMEETYIDKNYVNKDGDGYTFAKVRLRITRKPIIGDKFSSRHGQKGTVGNIIPECDMPFTKEGVRPDLIINPHAIPSRMTIGQLKESLLGKVLVQLGLFGDGSPFNDFTVDTIRKALLQVGFESNGNEVMYSGLTGEQLESSIFIGPVFYQRLKHMVNDKTHSRSYGPMVGLTRQPAEGRIRDGGLKFGEMERDCMISHGAASFTKERMYDVSDKYEMYVCKKCGMNAAYNDAFNIHHCPTCDNRTDFAHVNIPYSCKLLFQELNVMNIAPRIIVNS